MTFPHPPHVQWMIDRDAYYMMANARGATEAVSLAATNEMVGLENKLLETPAPNAASCFLRCLTVIKISADGHSIDDDTSRTVEQEADAFLAEQRTLQAAFNEAYEQYKRVRAISDAMPPGADGEDAAVDEYCVAMDHLIEKVRAPSIAALRIKIALADSRAEGFCGWFDDHRNAIMEDLAYLETRMLAA